MGFGGFPGGGNMQSLMNQAKKMQEQMQKAQAELEATELVGVSGGGLVKVTLTGKKDLVSVKIDPSVLDDAEMVEDLIAAAWNDANKQVDALSKKLLGPLGGAF